jgi:hypothetical protein
VDGTYGEEIMQLVSMISRVIDFDESVNELRLVVKAGVMPGMAHRFVPEFARIG